MRLVRQVAEIQRQARGVTTAEEARRVQLGNHRGCDYHFAFAAAKIVCRPGLRHDAQLTIKVANRHRHGAFAVFIQRHRLRLLGNDGDMVDRRFAAAVHLITVTAEAQRRKTTLAFNHLAVDIIDICAIAFLAEEGLPRIWRYVIGNIQHPAVDGGEQDVNLFRRRAIFHRGFDFDLQRLVRTHFLRGVEGNLQATVLITHR